MVVDPWHSYRYLYEDKDIYDNFKLKKPFGYHALYKNIWAFQGLTFA